MNFDIKKMLSKAVKGAISGAVGALSALLAKKLGLELTADQQIALIGSVTGLVLGLANTLKVKFPKIFGWL